MSLKVIIIGAGLGGLATAVALTREGHEVEVYEKSSFHNEVGAAINLQPNASRLVQRWGCDIDALQPVDCKHISAWTPQGELIKRIVDMETTSKELDIKDEWWLVHRNDLHQEMLATANRGFNGRKPKIYLSTGVESVDADAGEVTLTDGRKIQGDLIVGADGVHSGTVEAVMGHKPTKISTGQNCYRFLVPIKTMQANAETNSLLEDIGPESVHIFRAADRSFVVYPCRSGTVMNIGAFVPSDENETLGNYSWLNAGNKEQFLSDFADFSPKIRALCSMAEDLKLWSLASRDPPRTFFKGKLALIGDAAHPFLPHTGQGGAQAFEDAAALGTLFSKNTTPEQVRCRLELYNEVRYKRAITIMFNSRVPENRRHEQLDDLRNYIPDAEMPMDIFKYVWSWDVVEAATQALARSAKEDISKR